MRPSPPCYLHPPACRGEHVAREPQKTIIVVGTDRSLPGCEVVAPDDMYCRLRVDAPRLAKDSDGRYPGLVGMCIDLLNLKAQNEETPGKRHNRAYKAGTALMTFIVQSSKYESGDAYVTALKYMHTPRKTLPSQTRHYR